MSGAGGLGDPVADPPVPRIGCDVVDVTRLAGALDRRPGLRTRVFTARELAGARRGGVAAGSAVEVSRLAARWAAKEATRKALGDLRLPFHAVEVVSDAAGAPVLHLRGRPSALSCSLSHDGGVAMAVVLAPRLPTDHLHREEPAHAAG
jgi:holo-[acyl-carrier protein] synthase